MEALASEQALDDAVNEGMFNIKKFPKTSLPQRKKRHIYEGLDTSWIARDILKIPGTSKRTSKMSIYDDDARKSSFSVFEKDDLSKKPRTPYFKPNQKYRSFVRGKATETTSWSLPVLSHRSADIPVSYNNFYSSFIENGRINGDEETCQSRESARNNTSTSDNVKSGVMDSCMGPRTQENVPCIPLEKLMLHLDDIKRLMGREKNTNTDLKTEMSKSTKSLYRYQPVSSRQNLRTGVSFSRHGTRIVQKSKVTTAPAISCAMRSSHGFSRSLVSHARKIPGIDDVQNRKSIVPNITVLSPRDRYTHYD